MTDWHDPTDMRRRLGFGQATEPPPAECDDIEVADPDPPDPATVRWSVARDKAQARVYITIDWRAPESRR